MIDTIVRHMDPSSDSNDDHTMQPEPRSKRRRSAGEATKEASLNSQETGVMRGSYDPRHGSRFIGSGSGIHFIRTVYSMLAGTSAQAISASNATSPNDAVPGEDDELSSDRSAAANGSARGSSPDADLWLSNEVDFGHRNLHPPTFDALISWTKPYFENWHPIFPFLHAPTILNMFDLVSKNGLHCITAADRVILRALISLGIADNRQAEQQMSPPPAHFVFRNISQLMTDSQFAICQPATLENLQALFAAQLFLVSMLKFNFASRLGGTIVRMAFHLGLHRCPSRFRNFRPAENQLRRRMFFCVYCLDRILCQSLGLPLGINDTDIDVCLPGEEAHGLGDKAAKEAIEDTRPLQTLTMFAKHAKIRGMILELRNKSIYFRHETAKRATRIEMELSKWSNQLHEIIDDADDADHLGVTSECTISALHRLYLRLLEHESVISLNRPLITANKSSTNAMSALQNCIKASRSIITVLDDYRGKQDTLHDQSGRLAVPLTWPLVTWCCWMSCFILAFAALEGRSKLEFAIKYTERSLKILEHLSLRMTRWPDLCGDAVKHVRTALLKKATSSSDIDSPLSNRPPSQHSGVQASPGADKNADRTNPQRSLHREDTSASLAAPVSFPDAISMPNAWHSTQFTTGPYQVESPDTLAAQQGRFGSMDASFGFTDFSANAYDQGLFDPFSAIDLPNFTVFNYNFAQEPGSM